MKLTESTLVERDLEWRNLCDQTNTDQVFEAESHRSSPSARP